MPVGSVTTCGTATFDKGHLQEASLIKSARTHDQLIFITIMPDPEGVSRMQTSLERMHRKTLGE